MIFTIDLLFVKLRSIIVFPFCFKHYYSFSHFFYCCSFLWLFFCGCLVQHESPPQKCEIFWRNLMVFRRSGGGNTTREPTWPKFSADPFRGQGDFCFIQRFFYRWWFQIFFIFTPIWGRFPFLLIFFKWVETTKWVVLVKRSGAGSFRYMTHQQNGLFKTNLPWNLAVIWLDTWNSHIWNTWPITVEQVIHVKFPRSMLNRQGICLFLKGGPPTSYTCSYNLHYMAF